MDDEEAVGAALAAAAKMQAAFARHARRHPGRLAGCEMCDLRGSVAAGALLGAHPPLLSIPPADVLNPALRDVLVDPAWATSMLDPVPAARLAIMTGWTLAVERFADGDVREARHDAGRAAELHIVGWLTEGHEAGCRCVACALAGIIERGEHKDSGVGAPVSAGADAGHTFRVLVSLRGSYAIGDDPAHTDSAEFGPEPFLLDVRAWNLRDAMRFASSAPLAAWSHARLTGGADEEQACALCGEDGEWKHPLRWCVAANGERMLAHQTCWEWPDLAAPLVARLEHALGTLRTAPAGADLAVLTQAVMDAADAVVGDAPPSGDEPVTVAEGWWHPNVNAGRVHDHPERPNRSWSVTMHRQCELVYTRRMANPPTATPEPGA